VGSELAANIWDGGYPSGGNYWSDYTGLDVDSDGIGDTSYIIDVNNVDRYPLMHPWSLLPVHNINTGLGYTKIQQAINANETLDWHTIFVEAGTYNENVFVNKTVRLIGESRIGTIIDGEIDVTANNVIISGFAIGGFTVFVSGKRMYFGIRLFGANCTVSNNTVFNTGTGVWLLNSTDNVISNNALLYNVPYSVYLSDSSNNTISQNYIGSIEWKGLILPLDYGIELYRSSNNTIIQNNVTQCRRAIRMEGVIPFGELQSDSSNNTIIENNIEHWEWGISVSQSTNNTMVGNNITCLSDPRLGESSGISLGRSHFNSIAQNIIESNYEGLKLVDSHFNNISQNNARYNIYGILLESSAFNLLCRNIITRNYYGILVRSGYSEYINMLRYNNMTENRYNFGVGYWYFQDVDETNTVDGKPVYYWINRHDGQIPLDAGYVAIVNSTDIRVEGLDLKNNYQGIFIAYSNNVTICQNNITDNYDGIWLVASSNNTIYHNNFINNQAYSYESVNVWDDVYPSGGNYWSDYVGVDVKRGPNQDLSGSDGIGDTPYIIDANNRDRYPLMNPYGAPPPLTYALTITTTVGGTTDPAPGTCSYTANSQVQVTAFLNTTTYLFDHWELDSVNVGSANPYTVLMDKNHMLKAVFSPIPAPLSASITPLSASILVSQSVTFTSTVSGGYTPYSYQWYLNGNPVSGATSNAWAFTPTTSGTYYAHLKVTDAKGNTAQSDTARIVVSTVPVGGYSIPIQVPATATPLTPYIILTAILTIAFTTIKCKTTKKTKKPP
jgi:parallel beta-helix repeat protein